MQKPLRWYILVHFGLIKEEPQKTKVFFTALTLNNVNQRMGTLCMQESVNNGHLWGG